MVRALRKPLIGRTIKAFETDWEKNIKSPSVGDFAKQIKGQTVVSVSRRAKYVVIGFKSLYSLVVHLRMSGHLFVCASDADDDKYIHGKWSLDNKTDLRFRDTRKFGTLHLVPPNHTLFAKLAPEPLEPAFTVAVLRDALRRRSSMIKPLLLAQDGVVVGLGNIYCDEALFRAKVHPERASNSLTDDECAKLHGAIIEVLQAGIAREGASISTYRQPNGEKGSMQDALNVYGRTGKDCSECATPIKRIKLAQRSTHFCDNCQKEGQGGRGRNDDDDDSDDEGDAAAASDE